MSFLVKTSVLTALCSVLATAQTATTTSLSTPANPVRLGLLTSLTATVAPATTGTVEFLDGFRILGTAVLDAQSKATLKITFSLPRTYRIRAVYAAKAGYTTSISGVLPLSVRPLTHVTFNSSEFQNAGDLLADVTGDGIEEALVRPGVVRLGAGNGKFSQTVVSPLHQNTYNLYLGDLDGDGLPEHFTFDPSGTRSEVQKNGGAGQFSYLKDVLPVYNVLDFNHDGLLDLEVLESGLFKLQIGTGGGALVTTATAPCHGTVADLNGDGQADLVCLAGSTATAVLNYSQQQPGSIPADRIFIDDVNNDGRDDVVAYRDQIGIDVYLTQPNGIFGPGMRVNGSANLSVADLLDWDGDGKLDLLVIDSQDGTSLFYLKGNADGTFAGPQLITRFSQLGPYPITRQKSFRDLNGDGYLDISRPVSIQLGSGSGLGATLVEGNVVLDSQTSIAAVTSVYLRYTPRLGTQQPCIVQFNLTNGSALTTTAGCPVPATPFSVSMFDKQWVLRYRAHEYAFNFTSPVQIEARIVGTNFDTGYRPLDLYFGYQPLSITPQTGSGYEATFQVKVPTPAGLGAFIGLDSTIAGCSVFLDSSNNFNLFNGALNSPLVGGKAGSQGWISNGLCELNLALSGRSSVEYSTDWDIQTFTYSLKFSRALDGKSGFRISWNPPFAGFTWKVANADGTITPLQQDVISLAPTSGAGVGPQVFRGEFAHPGGVNQIYLGYLLILPTPNVVNFTARGSCLIEYNRISDGMRLIDNQGTGWLGKLSGETSGTLSNNFCSINIDGKTVTRTAYSLAYTVPVTLKPALGPVLGTFLQSEDVTGQWTGMTQFGNWVLPGAPQTRPGPQVLSLGSTASASSAYTFNLNVGSTGTPIEMVHLLISDKIVGGQPCQVVYFAPTNSLNLINEEGTALVASVNPRVGDPVMLSNRRCSVSASSVVKTGTLNNLQLTIPVQFDRIIFQGQKSAYGIVFDNSGLVSHWVQGAVLDVQ